MSTRLFSLIADALLNGATPNQNLESLVQIALTVIVVLKNSTDTDDVERVKKLNKLVSDCMVELLRQQLGHK